MCLILLAWQTDPRFPLVVAANRDEFHARPTAPLSEWPSAPGVFAGRDLLAGGTWFGFSRKGRFAGVTNYRAPAELRTDALSRGALVAGFLVSDESPDSFTAAVAASGGLYNGFNLLAGSLDDGLMYVSNRATPAVQHLAPGIHGLSNHLLNTDWPKVSRGRSALAMAMEALPDVEPLLALLDHRDMADDHTLPQTGVSLEWERLLSAAFVDSPAYGTRSSTVLVVSASRHAHLVEQRWDNTGGPAGRTAFSFFLSPD